MQQNRRRVIGMMGAMGAMGAWPFARANGPGTWPEKPLRIIMPYSAGGPTDALARGIAGKLTKAFGQSVLVENKTGASGNIGTDIVAKAAPDGYTMLYHSSGLAISPALYKQLSYDPVRDLAPVALTATIPVVLMVNTSSPVNNIQQFVEYARARSGKLSYGTGGVGNITHLSIALFLQAQGLKAIDVPYKGTAPALSDLVAGHLDFMCDAVSSALPFIRGQRVRPIAVMSATRASVLPDLPTVAETIIPGFEASTWHGLLLPAKTPPAIIARLNKEVNLAVSDPELKERFGPLGVELQTSTPEKLGLYLRAEIDRWKKAARIAGIEPE